MPVDPSNAILAVSRRTPFIAVAAVFLVVGLSLTAYRTWRQYSAPADTFDWQTRGHSDFHNGSYFPSLAFREGVNPYSSAVKEHYPLARSAPIYSPVVFVWHVPFTWVDVETGDVLFFIYNAALLGLLAWMGIAMSGSRMLWGLWLLLFGLLVFSRPGNVTLFTGYFTAELVIGTIIALHFAANRPWLSGVGMLIASGKPTYILPLIILMLCRRNFRAVAIGLMLCTIGGLLGLAWLASFASWSEVVQGINEGRLALHDDPTEDPVNTWTRIDLVGVIAKLTAWKPGDVVYLGSMLLLLALPGWMLWRLSPIESNRGATGLSALIVCLTILIGIYHHAYDCLLVVVPWIGLTFFQSIDRCKLSASARWAIAMLLAVPAVNYGSTRSFGRLMELEEDGALWAVLTSLNGVCLVLALGIALFSAYRFSKVH